ncbi:MAG: sialidase family protein [Gemmatimonadota bacterium]
MSADTPGRGGAPRPVDPPGNLFLDPEHIYPFRSRPARRVFVDSPAGKPYVIRLRSGEMLAACTHGHIADPSRDEDFWSQVRWSSDGGQTWSEPVRPFPGLPQTREATLAELADGRVLCFVHSRRRGVHTPTVTVSEDGGRTLDGVWKVGEYTGGAAASDRGMTRGRRLTRQAGYR